MGPPEAITMSNPIAYMAGALMIATCLISWQAFKKPALFDRLKFEIEAILGYRQYYRIFSSALIHINPMHLIFNMLCFYSFGEGLELQFGWSRRPTAVSSSHSARKLDKPRRRTGTV